MKSGLQIQSHRFVTTGLNRLLGTPKRDRQIDTSCSPLQQRKVPGSNCANNNKKKQVSPTSNQGPPNNNNYNIDYSKKSNPLFNSRGVSASKLNKSQEQYNIKQSQIGGAAKGMQDSIDSSNMISNSNLRLINNFMDKVANKSPKEKKEFRSQLTNTVNNDVKDHLAKTQDNAQYNNINLENYRHNLNQNEKDNHNANTSPHNNIETPKFKLITFNNNLGHGMNNNNNNDYNNMHSNFYNSKQNQYFSFGEHEKQQLKGLTNNALIQNHTQQQQINEQIGNIKSAVQQFRDQATHMLQQQQQHQYQQKVNNNLEQKENINISQDNINQSKIHCNDRVKTLGTFEESPRLKNHQTSLTPNRDKQLRSSNKSNFNKNKLILSHSFIKGQYYNADQDNQISAFQKQKIMHNNKANRTFDNIENFDGRTTTTISQQQKGQNKAQKSQVQYQQKNSYMKVTKRPLNQSSLNYDQLLQSQSALISYGKSLNQKKSLCNNNQATQNSQNSIPRSIIQNERAIKQVIKSLMSNSTCLFNKQQGYQ